MARAPPRRDHRTPIPELRARAWRALGGALDILGEHERAAPCYRQSLELFSRCGDEIRGAHMRFRVRGEHGHEGRRRTRLAAARRRTSLSPGSSASGSGEGEALGFLAQRRTEDGDLATAVERSLESAAIAREVGWTWWEAGELGSAATIERERGQPRRRRGPRASGARARPGDSVTVSTMVFAAPSSRASPLQRGDAARAGLLWGAVEARRAPGASASGSKQHAAIEALVLAGGRPGVRRGLRRGRLALDRPGRRPRDRPAG